MWDALSEDNLVDIASFVDDLMALSMVCKTCKRAVRCVLVRDYAERLSILLGATRISDGNRTPRMRWLCQLAAADGRFGVPKTPRTLRCGLCGRETCGLLMCDCHRDRSGKALVVVRGYAVGVMALWFLWYSVPAVLALPAGRCVPSVITA